MSSRSPHRPNARVISSAKHSNSGVDRRRTPSAVLAEIREAAPSSILRARDEASREEHLKDFVQDLKFVAKLAKAIK